MSRRNVVAQLSTLKPTDVLITPALGDFSASDFGHAAKAIAIGKAAADAARAQLAVLGVPAAEYAERGSAQHAAELAGAPVIDFILLNNHSRIADEVIKKKLAIELGQPFNREHLERGIADLYGLELFRSVRYVVVADGDKRGLEINVEERTWGPDYLKFGLALSSDLEGGSLWDIGASYRKTALNNYAGELLFAGQIGENPAAGVEFYQPLDPDLRWFVESRLLYATNNVSFYEGNDEIEEYRVNRYGGALAAGRELGRWGEVRMGLRRFSGMIDLRVGDPSIPDQNFDSAEVFAKVGYDTLDSRNFPQSGGIAALEWVESVESMGADANFAQLNVNAIGARAWSRFTLAGGAQFQYTADGVAPIQNRYRIGGFTRLSGFAQDELSGQQVLLLRGLAYHRISEISWMSAYVGASLEYGNVYEGRGDISLDPHDALLSASLFLGVDLPIGPLYLGYGHAERGNDSLFMFLGRLF